MIRGETKNVALTPIPYPGLDPVETFVPRVIEVNNGRLTDAGNWTKRPGIGLYRATDRFQPIHLLVPYAGGLAVNATGNVYRLNPLPADGLAARATGALKGSHRPTWANYAGTVVFADGAAPQKLDYVKHELDDVAGDPPPGRFIAVLDTYLVLAGYQGTQFRWSDTNTFETWPAENLNSCADEGQTLEMMRVYQRKLWFFLSGSIEVWGHVGGDSVFVRQYRIDRGTPAGHSVVLANDRLHFFGDDGAFYVMEGIQPRQIPQKAPDQLRGILERIKNRTQIYGFDFPKEHVIRWCAPVEGITFTYDYKNDLFLEDYEWVQGGPQRVRVNAAMLYSDGEMYIGENAPTGRICSWADLWPTDLGQEIRVQRIFQVPLSSDGTTARVNRLRLRALRGQGVPSPAPFGVGGPEKAMALLRWRFDQDEWAPYHEINLGAVGESDPYVELHRLGIGREITFDLVETDAVKWLLTHAYLTVENLGR
jgi:hypothetical protein